MTTTCFTISQQILPCIFKFKKSLHARFLSIKSATDIRCNGDYYQVKLNRFISYSVQLPSNPARKSAEEEGHATIIPVAYYETNGIMEYLHSKIILNQTGPNGHPCERSNHIIIHSSYM